VRVRAIIAALFMLASVGTAQTGVSRDDWDPFRFFVGRWEGTGNGQPGVSKTQREYKFVLNNKFLQIQNRSVYSPQPKNPKGETHEDWGFLSFDKVGKKFVLRQFHGEGFVNEYIMSSSSADGKTIVFITERIENIPTGFRARETYKILGPDAFVEVFELAEPGKDFELYSENRYVRMK
jgi:hypothetical protein